MRGSCRALTAKAHVTSSDLLSEAFATIVCDAVQGMVDGQGLDARSLCPGVTRTGASFRPGRPAQPQARADRDSVRRMTVEPRGLRLVSHAEYLEMVTWQRLVGNAVTEALSGHWSGATRSAREAAGRLPAAVRTRVSPAERERQDAERRARRSRQDQERLVDLETWQRASAVVPQLVELIRQSPDDDSLLRRIAQLLELPEQQATSVLDLRLGSLTPTGQRVIELEIGSRRRRLDRSEPS